MATKKTQKAEAPKSAPKTAKATKPAKAPKAAAGKIGPRHPHGRVTAAHAGKEALANALASTIARKDEDTGALAARLKKASNQQLLRLQRVAETVKAKWGGRDKLIAAIGSAQQKTKDKDFLAKLESYSLPQLLDLATSGERRARA